jgi:hypothetical protein
MPQVNIKSSNAYEETIKKDTLQYLADNLSVLETQNLFKIAKSTKARAYLGSKFSTLKFFLKL